MRSSTTAAASCHHGPSKRPLKSLSDMLKGKSGRFRQNLLESAWTTPVAR